MKDTLNELTKGLNAQIAQVRHKFHIRTVENITFDHNMLFIQGALMKATQDMLMFTVDDESSKRL